MQRKIPDLFLMQDGLRADNLQAWQTMRRPDLLELFRSHVYGREPADRPSGMRYEVEISDGYWKGKAKRKIVTIHYEGPGGKGEFQLLIFLPIQQSPCPLFLLINNRGTAVADLEQRNPSAFWPAEFMVDKGYAAAVFHVGELDPDHDDGFRNGVHGIFDSMEKPRPVDAWGTISAWAWGASRAMDYMEQDEEIDSSRVAVVGHSRGGKTALWAGAIDERFAMVVSNNSGCTGAALSRGKSGETIKNINTSFPHWFAESYKAYNDREEDLPIDQHMLLALIAPRPLYIASASEDEWADPSSEFAAIQASKPAYRLFGYEGLSDGPMPSPGEKLWGDRLAYHLRKGKHDMEVSDWLHFLEFADFVLK